MNRMAGALTRLKGAYQKLDRAAGGRLELAREIYVRFVELRGPEAAAALAYYALFSLFPLALFLIAILSFILSNSEQAYYQTLLLVRTAMPVSRRLIEENLQQVYEHRGSLGVIGFAWLLWSATGFFHVLARNINMAWPSARLRNVMQSRLAAAAMVGGLFVLLLLSFVSTSVVQSLPAVLVVLRLDPGILESPLWRAVARLAPGVFTWLMFLALYLWVPNTAVHWSAAWRGALAAAVGWELSKDLFSTYVSSSLNSYELLYGSLGALAALLFWIFISSVIVLLGAQMVAVLDIRVIRAEEARAGASGAFAAPAARTISAPGYDADDPPRRPVE